MSQPTYKTLKQTIVEFNPGAERWLVNGQTDLFEIGAFDSINIIELIPVLEKRFSFVFDFTDLRAVHFQNLESLQKMLSGKYGLQLD